METVKLSGNIPVRAAKTNSSAVETTDSRDAFLKLLQEKKELAEPAKSQTKETDSGKAPANDSQKASGKEPVKDSGETQGEKAEEPSGQEALLAAAMEQAAIQMAGLVTEDGSSQQAAEAVEESVETGALIPAALPEAETKPIPETGAEESQAAGRTGQAAADQTGQAAEPVHLEREGEAQSGSPEKESHRGQEADPAVRKSDSQTRTAESRKETRPQAAARTEREAEKPEIQETRESVQEPVYGTSAAEREPAGRPFRDSRTETVPLRTNESRLPQDLGKTLAARLPGNGREMVIELEPAALGKLTIRLTYDGDRAAVSILASNPRTLELLSQKASEIASILEEKTGQETIIYTQAPEKENQDSQENPSHGGRQEQSQENRRGSEKDRHETESFALQLRLGLI